METDHRSLVENVRFFDVVGQEIAVVARLRAVPAGVNPIRAANI